MPYLNLDVNYFDHIKTVRLIGLLGRGAAELPIRLWSYCGKHKAKDGDLAGYSAQEIESIVGWWGKTGECVESLIKVGFMERTSAGYRVHDWENHEGHLISFHERARAAAKARWGYATSMPQALLEDDVGNAPTVPTKPAVPTRPTKPVTPARAPTERFVKPTPEDVRAYAASIGFRLDGERFCAHYESNGWRVGKVPMKSWKAAVVTWKKDAHYSQMIASPPAAKPPDPKSEDCVGPADIKEFLSVIGKNKGVPR